MRARAVLWRLMVLKAMREHRRNAPRAALLAMRGESWATTKILVLRSSPQASVSKDGARAR
ncbi:hypothetical protein ACVIJ6_004241 [Bradyrhizobium sp. USDA 4369]